MKCIRSRAPIASSPSVRRVMQANVGRQTTPELVFRRALHAAGLRFRKDVQPEWALHCKADVVFSRKKVCIFVDGCFWHKCPIHFELPKTNTEWWDEKIDANVVRDMRQTKWLEDHGWQVIRVWEHETIGHNLHNIVEHLKYTLTKKYGASTSSGSER